MARPYQGATVTDEFKYLWRFGGQVSRGTPGKVFGRFYGGKAKQQVHVFIRRGKLVRRYHPTGIDGDFGQPGGRVGLPFWYPDWTPDPGAVWEEVPAIKEVRLVQDFSNNGLTSASIDIDNVLYQEVDKGLGIFHLIKRGWFSPLYGYSRPGMPAAPVQKNEWFLKMPNAQIMVTEGYGTEVVPVFTGLIDDLDLNGKPATITVTARDFGGVLVDEHFFGWAQERRIPQVTFVPRHEINHIPHPLPRQNNSHLIPIDDIADIARIVFRWAGFKEWEVEDSGTLLKDRIVCNTGDTFMTLLSTLRDFLGYTFFMAEPTSMESIGRPIFRLARVLENTQSEIERVSDRDVLTQIKVKWTNQQERYIIRMRGALLAASKGGSRLSTDSAERAMFVYRPPWHDRMAGVIKHLTHYSDKMVTVTDCQIGAYLVAMQIGLAAVTVILEIPGTPHIGLDSFLTVVDDQTGLSGRLYVTNRTSTLTTGEDAQWKLSLGGAFVDTPDIQAIAAQYTKALQTLGRNAG